MADKVGKFILPPPREETIYTHACTKLTSTLSHSNTGIQNTVWLKMYVHEGNVRAMGS